MRSEMRLLAATLAALFASLSALRAGDDPPRKDGDPVQVDSQWKGKVTQRGEYPGLGVLPPEFEAVLAVTKRTGADFEGELRLKVGDSSVIYLIKGKVGPGSDSRSYDIAFDWVGVKEKTDNFVPAKVNVPSHGTIADKKMKGTWKYPKNDQGITIEGGFDLDLK